MNEYTETSSASDAKLLSQVTLSAVLEKYFFAKRIRPSTESVYRRTVSRCLSDWLDLPISAITKDMVVERHKLLGTGTTKGTSGEATANLAMRILRALLNFAADEYEIDGEPAIAVNPVQRLSRNKSWFRVQPRQSVIPDHKLSSWYQAVIGLQNGTIRDYLLLLLFTGLRRNEAAKLKWTDVDLEGKMLIVRSENSKNHREHRLPLSDFLYALLIRRRDAKAQSEYVFPGRAGGGHIVEFRDAINEVREKSGCEFKIHDCRRTFLTLAERINTPHYVLKKLVNHSSGSDVTAGYIIVDVERLRGQMARISERILAVIAGEIIAPQESIEDQTKGYFLKHTATPNGLGIEIVFAKDIAMA